MKRIFLFFVLCLLAITAQGRSFTVKYKGARLHFQTIKGTENQVAYEHGYDTRPDTLYIPGTVELDGKLYYVKATQGNPYGYDTPKTLHSTKVIFFEEGIEVIGEASFAELNELIYVHFPSTLKRIEKGAFAFTGLTDIEIPESVDYIGPDAFWGDQHFFKKINGNYYRGTLTLPKHQLVISEGSFSTASYRTKRQAISYFKIKQLPAGTTFKQIEDWGIGKADKEMLDIIDGVVVTEEEMEKGKIVEY